MAGGSAQWKVLCKPALMEGWRSYFGYGLKGRNTSATAAIPAGYVNHAMVSLTAERKEQTPSSNSRHHFFPSLTSPWRSLQEEVQRQHSLASSTYPATLPCSGGTGRRTAKLPVKHPSFWPRYPPAKKTRDPVTPTWQEEGTEPSIWTPSQRLCEQQPPTLLRYRKIASFASCITEMDNKYPMSCSSMSLRYGAKASSILFPLYMLRGNVFMSHGYDRE